jgi:hypothetical protein
MDKIVLELCQLIYQDFLRYFDVVLFYGLFYSTLFLFYFYIDILIYLFYFFEVRGIWAMFTLCLQLTLLFFNLFVLKFTLIDDILEILFPHFILYLNSLKINYVLIWSKCENLKRVHFSTWSYPILKLFRIDIGISKYLLYSWFVKYWNVEN